MAEIFYFQVNDDRSISRATNEPIMQEDSNVAIWRFRIPKTLNNIDMTGFAWWIVTENSHCMTYSNRLTLTDDLDEPDEFSIADYYIDWAVSVFPGKFSYALEAINANESGVVFNEWHTKTYYQNVTATLQGNQAEYAETQSDIISALIVQIQEKYNALTGGATPQVVGTVLAMTDTSKIYVLSTDGNWYWHNGSAWVSGGKYAAGVIYSDDGDGNITVTVAGG